MERARPPADISPRDFFTSWIGDAVDDDPDRRRSLGDTEATIVFDLTGPDGGTFAIRIESQRVRGREGDSEAADLRVRVDVDTWRDLNAGRIAAPQALLKRRIKLEGDFLLGLRLHLILG
ncbi:MAG: SCP2 sterol-binding domain-containing protein [Myxococcota bacterium]